MAEETASREGEQLSSVGQLVREAAHELSNSLATILLAAEVLLDQETDPKKKGRLEGIIEQVERGSALVEDLRLFVRREEACEEARVAGGAAREPVPPMDFEGLEVLIVDDEAEIVALLAEMLRRANCAVDEAFSGIEALELARNKSYDVVLCDLKMPRMDGVAYVNELEKVRPELVERVVFMSGHTAASETERALVALPNASLAKPFTYTELMRAIDEVVGERIQEPEFRSQNSE